MKSRTDPRHNSRKYAMASIFSWLFSEQENNDCANLCKELEIGNVEDFDPDLNDTLVSGVKTHLEEIDKIIEQAAPEWPLDKIAKVDLVILRIAIFELIFANKTPVKVAIDEAIEMAKEFGNETSHKFVNGVLGTVVENYKVKEEKEEK